MDRPRARVAQKERACAIRTFGGAGVKAPLAKKGRLLISGDAGDRNPRRQKGHRRSDAELAGARLSRGKDCFGNLEIAAKIKVPAWDVEIQEQRARGVG